MRWRHWVYTVPLRLRSVFRRGQVERQLNDELAFHLDAKTAEGLAQGLSREEARYAALRAMDALAQRKEECRDMRRVNWIDDLLQDTRYGLRTLRRAPGFTAVAILSMALGIGANTAVFSLLDAVMLRSLPVHAPEELRVLTWVRTKRVPVKSHSGYGARDSRTGQNISGSFSYPAYVRLAATSRSFYDLVAFAGNQFTVTADGNSEFVNGQFVSGNYFTGLGVQPLIGRAILPDDDRPGRARVAVLTHRYWERRFGMDPNVIGKRIAINQQPVTVIGVMQPAFQGLFPGRALDLFVPITAVREMGTEWYRRDRQDNWWVQIFGRIRPNVPDEAAAAEIRSILAGEIESYAGGQTPPPEVPQVLLSPGDRGVDMLRNDFTTPLAILLGAVVVVLLIACTNLAGLLLARAAARRNEIALRFSLGAGRGRLVRQACTESLLLAGAGGVLGLILAQPLARLVLNVAGGASPLGLEVRVDLRALAFTAAVSLLTGVLFGALPAWWSGRVNLASNLKAAAGRTSGLAPRLRLGRVLMVGQVALSLVLLAGAGLFVRTLIGLKSVDLGFRAERVLTFQTDPSRNGYTGQRLANLYRRLQANLAALPGVASVGMSQHGLIQGVVSSDNVHVPGHAPKPGEGRNTLLLFCSDSFLSTMQIPVLLGRDLAGTDWVDSPLVAVVNEAFARHFFPGEHPVERTFYLGDGIPAPGAKPIRVVGVARDSRYHRVRADVEPIAYLPYAQRHHSLRQMTVAIRTTLPPQAIAGAVRRAVAEIDPAIPVAELRTLEEQIDLSLGRERLYAGLVSAFAFLALVLGAIGLYGLIAYSVASRTAELGIRLALGAQRASIQWLVLKASLGVVVAGTLVGIPSALALGRLVVHVLYGVKPTDLVSLGVAVVVIAVAATAAAGLPAWRASRLDPLASLRHD